MDIIEVEVPRAAKSSRRLALWVLGLLIVAALGAALAVVTLTRGDDASPDPVPPPAANGVVGPDEAVALMWSEWLARTASVDCLAEVGIASEARFLSYEDYAVVAARELEIEPAYREPLAPGILGEDPEDPEDPEEPVEGTQNWFSPVSEGGCIQQPGLVDVGDATVVADYRSAAASDTAFREEVAAKAWEHLHPEEWQARWTEVLYSGEREPLTDAAEAERLRDEAVAILERDLDWVSFGAFETPLAATAYGAMTDGSVVVVQVEGAVARHLSSWTGSADGPPAVCGEYQVIVVTSFGSRGYEELREDARDALDASWCGGAT